MSTHLASHANLHEGRVKGQVRLEPPIFLPNPSPASRFLLPTRPYTLSSQALFVFSVFHHAFLHTASTTNSRTFLFFFFFFFFNNRTGLPRFAPKIPSRFPRYHQTTAKHPHHHPAKMSVVTLLGVEVLNNPAKFGDKYQFEITFECLEPLEKGSRSTPLGTPPLGRWWLVFPPRYPPADTGARLQISSGS